jgi:hypothetical protein
MPLEFLQPTKNHVTACCCSVVSTASEAAILTQASLCGSVQFPSLTTNPDWTDLLLCPPPTAKWVLLTSRKLHHAVLEIGTKLLKGLAISNLNAHKSSRSLQALIPSYLITGCHTSQDRNHNNCRSDWLHSSCQETEHNSRIERKYSMSNFEHFQKRVHQGFQNVFTRLPASRGMSF